MKEKEDKNNLLKWAKKWTNEIVKDYQNLYTAYLIFGDEFINANKRFKNNPEILRAFGRIIKMTHRGTNNQLYTVYSGLSEENNYILGAILLWLNWFWFTVSAKCPQEFYKLKPEHKVVFNYYTKHSELSKKMLFKYVKPLFESEFNKKYFPINPNIKSRLNIPNNNTIIFPNTSDEATNAGYSMFSFVAFNLNELEMPAWMRRKNSRFTRNENSGMGILIRNKETQNTITINI